MSKAREYYEERSAILEYDGEFTRHEAERIAARELRDSHQFTGEEKREVLG